MSVTDLMAHTALDKALAQLPDRLRGMLDVSHRSAVAIRSSAYFDRNVMSIRLSYDSKAGNTTTAGRDHTKKPRDSKQGSLCL